MNLGLLDVLTRSASTLPLEPKAENLNAAATVPAATGGNGQPFEKWVKHYSAESQSMPAGKSAAMDAAMLKPANVPATEMAALMQLTQTAGDEEMQLASLETAMLEPLPADAIAMMDATSATDVSVEAQAVAALSAGPAIVTAVDEEDDEQQNPLAPVAELSEEIQAVQAATAPLSVQTEEVTAQPAEALDALSISQDHADEVVVALPVMPGMVPAAPDETAVEVAMVTAVDVAAPETPALEAPVSSPAIDQHSKRQSLPPQAEKGQAIAEAAQMALAAAQRPDPGVVAQQVHLAMEQQQHQATVQAPMQPNATQQVAVQAPGLHVAAARQQLKLERDAGIEMTELESQAPDMDDAELEAVVARLLQEGRADARSTGQVGVNMSPQHYNAAASQPMNLVGAPTEFVAAPEAAAQDDVLSVGATAPHGASVGHEQIQRLGAAMQSARGEHFADISHQGSPSEQVQVSIRRALGMGVDRVTVQLQPEDLGRVEVRLDVNSDGRSTVIFNVDNRDTLDLLQRDAKQLERVLQESGINANAGDMQFNLQQRNARDEGEAQQGGRYSEPASVAAAEAEAYVDTTTGHYTVTVNNGVDIRV